MLSFHLDEHKRADEYPYGPQPPIMPVTVATAGSDDLPVSIGGLPLLVALLSLAVVGDLAILPLAEFVGPRPLGELPVLFLAGGIFAQAAILALLLVFGDRPFRRRLVGCWSAAIILWGCWAAGGIAARIIDGNSNRMLLDITILLQLFGLALPLAGIAVQSPLWFFRLYLGWRLISPAGQPNALRPLSIQDYLLGTAIAAVSLALARSAPLDTSPTGSREYWWDWAMFAAFAGPISLCSVIPAMLLMFRCRDWRIGYALLILHGAVGGLLFMGIVALNSPIPSLWEIFFGVVLFSSFAIFLGAGLKAIRDMGYSLVLGRAHV